MIMTTCEKDNLLGQIVLPPEPSKKFFKKVDFFQGPFIIIVFPLPVYALFEPKWVGEFI